MVFGVTGQNLVHATVSVAMVIVHAPEYVKIQSLAMGEWNVQAPIEMIGKSVMSTLVQVSILSDMYLSCRKTSLFDSIASLTNIQNEITLMVLFLHAKIALPFSRVKILQSSFARAGSWFLPFIIPEIYICFRNSRDAEALCRFGLSP